MKAIGETVEKMTDILQETSLNTTQSIKGLKDEEIIEKLKELAVMRPENDPVEQQYFAELFKRYSKQAYNLCRYFGLRHADADEIVQDSFFKLYDKILYIDSNRSFKPYFFKMLHNLTKNRFRSLSRLTHYHLDDITDSQLEPSENFSEDLDINEHIREMIERLPEKERAVVLLKIFAGMTPIEISESLGVHLKSVYYRLGNGFRSLKREWEEDFDTDMEMGFGGMILSYI